MPDPKKKQQKGKATRQDSLDVYNNSRKVEQFYKKEGYKPNSRLVSFKINPKNTHNENDFAYNNFSHVDEQIGGNWYGNPTITKSDYRKNIDKNKYTQREIPYQAINIDAPMQLFDRRIIPKSSVIIGKSLDVVSFGSYNNIANKPFDLLTEKEKVQRVKQYGRSGVPDSYGKKVVTPQKNYVAPIIKKSGTTTGKQVKEDNKRGMVLNETFQKKPITQINNNTGKKPKYDYPIGYDGLKEYEDVVKPKDTPQVTPLQQIQTKGLIESNQQINTPLATVRPQAQMPKSWNVTDTNNQRFGGTETNYKLYPDTLNTIRELPKEGWDRKITPQYAMGGQLNNNMQNNNLTRFDEGGLHHQNPLGGIPVGGNNTVEQGETKIKNYVYSNRIAIDENMTKEMNLPNYIKGKTFADASKAIDNKFKDRNDKHSLETKNVFLDRLKQAQETVKQQEQQRAEQIAQSMQSNQQEVPDMMNGQIPEGMEEFTEQNQMFMGGDFNIAEVGNITGGLAGLAGKASPYLGAAATGAQAGSMFGPVGMGVGAAVGLGAGLLGANKAKKQQALNLRNNANSANLTDSFAYGGSIKKFDGGGLLDSLGLVPLADDLIKPKTLEEIQAYQLKNNIAKQGDEGFGTFGPKTTAQFELDKKNWTPETPNTEGLIKKPNAWDKEINPGIQDNKIIDSQINPFEQSLSKKTLAGDNVNSNSENNEGSWLDRNGGKILKYAPIAANALQLANLKKPTYTRLDRLTNRFKPEYVDEAQLQNIANNEMNNSVNSISQIGGSQGAVRNAILGAGLNKTKALSNAYMDASAQNRQTNMAGQQFNLNVDQANINQANQELDINDKNQAAYRNEKSKYISAIGTDLGEIGKEEIFKNQAEKMTGYSWMGDFLKSNPDYKAQYDAIAKDSTLDDNMKYAKQKALADKIFQGLTPEQRKQAEDYQNSTRTYGLPQAYGGYLKMNKIGRK